MSYDPEFFDEPNEYEIMVHQFKQSLMDSVKDEYKAEMEQLRKENAELQDTKKHMTEIERDFANRKRQLENEYQQLKANVRRERLSDLLGDFKVELFTVASKSQSQPKCDKCDERRRIPYKTPLGKETYETCSCSKSVYIYEPIPTILSEFSIREGKAVVWYKVKDKERYYEWLTYHEDSISGNELITEESQFDKSSVYRTLFKTKELAQKFCDLKNIEQGKKLNEAVSI